MSTVSELVVAKTREKSHDKHHPTMTESPNLKVTKHTCRRASCKTRTDFQRQLCGRSFKMHCTVTMKTQREQSTHRTTQSQNDVPNGTTITIETSRTVYLTQRQTLAWTTHIHNMHNHWAQCAQDTASSQHTVNTDTVLTAYTVSSSRRTIAPNRNIHDQSCAVKSYLGARQTAFALTQRQTSLHRLNGDNTRMEHRIPAIVNPTTRTNSNRYNPQPDVQAMRRSPLVLTLL